MAEIQAFRGIRYRTEGGDATRLVAPPYDIISPAQQDELYARDARNVVRVDFGKESPEDTESANRYTRSKDCVEQWLREGALFEEDAPALYLYEVDYTAPSGEAKTMSGFVCMLKLEEWDKGVVLPHEGTLKGPKKDRFELLKETGVSASQIFSLYSDPKKLVTKALKAAAGGRAPDVHATDDDGAAHRVWAVKDADAIKAVRAALAGQKIFIADGHHRYETALAYRDHCRKGGMSAGAFEFVPMFLANMDEDGLTILPTHRLVRHEGAAAEEILKKSSRYFDVEKLPFTEEFEPRQRRYFLESLEKKGKDGHAFGLYCRKEPFFYYLLTLKDLDPVIEALRCKRSEAYCRLDVTLLHELVIDRVLGIDTETISESQPVQFEKDSGRAIERVASGEFDLCFLLNPTKVEEVKAVALAREIMPQKSTYFYPKLLTGLVMARLL